MIRNSPPLRYPELGLICLGAFIELVGVGAVVPIRAIYAREHGATAEEIGLLGSGFLLGQFLFQLPAGWASDKWGRKPVIVTGMALAGLITFLFLLNDQPWYFISLRFLEGMVAGGVNPAANAYVMDIVPRKERGVAFGWLGSSISAGFMMGPAIGGILADTLGYNAPFIFGGATILVTALFLAVKMTNRKPGALLAEPLEPESDADAHKARPRVPRQLFVPALVAALAFTVAGGLGDGIFISIWSLWLNDLHASTSLIGFTFIVFSLPLMVLMPFTGKMADKYRLAPLIMIPGILISFVYLTYGFTTDLLLITSLGLVEGTFISVMIPAQSAFIANMSPENSRGRLQGLLSTVRTVAGFSSSMAVAILYGLDRDYPWYLLFTTQILISIVGGLLVWRVERRTHALARVAALKPYAEQPAQTPVLGTAAK
jgi:DHA1 family multidrug resistance protein-like MFS transporter